MVQLGISHFVIDGEVAVRSNFKFASLLTSSNAVIGGGKPREEHGQGLLHTMEDAREIDASISGHCGGSSSLGLLMDAVRILSGSRTTLDGQKRSLEQVLASRLARLKELDISDVISNDITLLSEDSNELRRVTSSTGLGILQKIDEHLRTDPTHEVSMNDQAALRAAVSVVFRWKVETETTKFNTSTAQDRAHALKELVTTTTDLLKTVFPELANADRSIVGTIVLHQHGLELLPPMFSLGWLSPGAVEEGPQIRAATLRILSR